jgi:hypothetical protein
VLPAAGVTTLAGCSFSAAAALLPACEIALDEPFASPLLLLLLLLLQLGAAVVGAALCLSSRVPSSEPSTPMAIDVHANVSCPKTKIGKTLHRSFFFFLFFYFWTFGVLPYR